MKLKYQKHGNGKPIVLIHGFPLDSKMWTDTAESLIAEGFQVILPDLRFEANIEDSLANTAESIAHIIISLKLKKVIVGGLSMGGYVSFNLYRLYPELVAALILCDTNSSADSTEKRNSRFETIDQLNEKGNQALLDSMLENLFSKEILSKRPDIVEKVKQWIEDSDVNNNISALKAMANRIDHDYLLNKINIPTKIIFGENDKITDLTIANKLHQNIKNSELSIIPNAGHLSNLEQPVLFNASILDFVTRIND
ncbi:MAG: alpha/beta hydrolase [Pyrinomonadaceae bacterium]|nr:alpha/beta hydrolase [Pyrinomonadaceae bacterium]